MVKRIRYFCRYGLKKYDIFRPFVMPCSPKLSNILFLEFIIWCFFDSSGQFNTTLYVTANIQHPDIVQLVPPTVEIPGSNEPNGSAESKFEICAYGKSPGHSEITFNVTPSGIVRYIQLVAISATYYKTVKQPKL